MGTLRVDHAPAVTSAAGRRSPIVDARCRRPRGPATCRPRTAGSSRQRPVSRSKRCLWSGDDTMATSPTEATSPRASTGTPVNGSMWSMAKIAPSASRNSATGWPSTARRRRGRPAVRRGERRPSRTRQARTRRSGSTRDSPCRGLSWCPEWSCRHPLPALGDPDRGRVHVGGVDELDEVGEPLRDRRASPSTRTRTRRRGVAMSASISAAMPSASSKTTARRWSRPPSRASSQVEVRCRRSAVRM